MELFCRVAENPRVAVASLQNLGNDQVDADRAVKALCAKLSSSCLVAVNLGEYQLRYETVVILLESIRSSCIGHLYITERPGGWGSLKNELRFVMCANRKKRGYLQEIVKPGMISEVRSARPWWAPRQNPEWREAREVELQALLQR